ncbi:ras-related protein Rab-7a-like isoform X2 [Rhinatrema bivittatum]|uniref:ras-related protein Rab-7a-like isoform X2 n=1 Tax=Rhinatrema bivittatum TaxID=194408 RepID=UPI00112B7022|nr:ras-related protein Rab-7a-like isoform X2 [Rhinatrema bivittatum]XP_029465818.1 ras-related protein Rab-7a-like isoform X2 [Rhinatrema bivittatum]
MFRRSHLKLILIGNSGVGKSSLMNQYVNHRFTNHYRATIGADFLTMEVQVDNKAITVQIWDTAGTERFQSLGTALYRGSDCCLLVFDITSPTSFQAVDFWRKEFLVQADPSDPDHFPFVVVANKMDLTERKVPQQQVQDWCEAFNALYFETSAKDIVNVEEAFQSAIRLAIKNQKEPSLPEVDSIQLPSASSDVHAATSRKCSC